MVKIEDLEISVRAYNALRSCNIETVEDLVCKSLVELLNTRNFGRKSLSEIVDVLADLGLTLHGEKSNDILEREALKFLKSTSTSVLIEAQKIAFACEKLRRIATVMEQKLKILKICRDSEKYGHIETIKKQSGKPRRSVHES